jgi:hypothetical protein
MFVVNHDSWYQTWLFGSDLDHAWHRALALPASWWDKCRFETGIRVSHKVRKDNVKARWDASPVSWLIGWRDVSCSRKGKLPSLGGQSDS